MDDTPTVVLVSTNHEFQCLNPLDNSEEIRQHQEMITDLCFQHSISAIAEEMSFEALKMHGLTKTVAQQVCASLHLRHQFSDPPFLAREELGIFTDNDIRTDHRLKGSTKDVEDADAQARGSAHSNPLRKKFWLKKIRELNSWPLLFICGENHFRSFAELLSKYNIKVVSSQNIDSSAIAD